GTNALRHRPVRSVDRFPDERGRDHHAGKSSRVWRKGGEVYRREVRSRASVFFPVGTLALLSAQPQEPVSGPGPGTGLEDRGTRKGDGLLGSRSLHRRSQDLARREEALLHAWPAYRGHPDPSHEAGGRALAIEFEPGFPVNGRNIKGG